MTEPFPSDLPILTPEEREAVERAHLSNPWEVIPIPARPHEEHVHHSRSPHTDFPRAFDRIGPDGEIEHHVVVPDWQPRVDVRITLDSARFRESMRVTAEAMLRVFQVPGWVLGLDRPTKRDLAVQRRLATQIRRTERRAARRARRAARGR